MILQSNRLKAGLSVMLVLAIFAFKIVDLHQYVHGKDSVKGTHCELCLLTHKQKQSLDYDLPVNYTFEVASAPEEFKAPIQITQVKLTDRFYFGNSANKAPPVLSV